MRATASGSEAYMGLHHLNMTRDLRMLFCQQLYQMLPSVFKKTFALRGSFPFLVVFFGSIAHQKNLLQICVSNPTSLPKNKMKTGV